MAKVGKARVAKGNAVVLSSWAALVLCIVSSTAVAGVGECLKATGLAPGGADAPKSMWLRTGQVAEPESFAEAVTTARRAAWDEDAARLRGAYTNCLAMVDRPAEGIVVPVESWPSGATKVSATARRAQFFEKEGLVWCGGVTLREYGEDGAVRMSFEADGCLVDRNAKTGWLEGRAHGNYGRTSLSGSGIYFSFSEEFVKIFTDVEIVSSEFKFEGVKL